MRWSILSAVTTLLMGCAVNPPFKPLDAEPIMVQLHNATPTEWCGAVAACSINFDPSVLNKGAVDRHALKPDSKWLNNLITNAVQRSRVLKKVISLKEKGEAALSAAWEANADILIVPHLLIYEAFYAGSNKLYIWNIINWIFLWAPSWFVRDELYGVRGEIELRFISCHSGRLLWRGVAAFKTSRSLDDFQRGWKFFGIFTVPKSLNESNWLKVDRSLKPFVEKEIKLALLKVLHQDARRALKEPSILAKLGKRCGLFVGINRYRSSGLPRLSFAADDAANFARLVRPKNQPTVNRNFTVLVDNAATKDAVLASLNRIVRRSTPYDEVIVYFAGYGTVRQIEKKIPLPVPEPQPAPKKPHKESNKDKKKANGEKKNQFKKEPKVKYVKKRYLSGFILLFDSNPKAKKPGLGMEELLKILSACRARKVLVVLDCGFNSERPCRGASEENLKGKPDYEPLKAFVGKKGRFVLLAGRYCIDGAAEFEHHKAGVLTGYLVAAQKAGAEADTDRDGRFTLAEMTNYAFPRVAEETQMEACPQQPVLYGKGAEEFVICVGRGKR